MPGPKFLFKGTVCLWVYILAKPSTNDLHYAQLYLSLRHKLDYETAAMSLKINLTGVPLCSMMVVARVGFSH